jgi:uncharacterized protein (DUF1684 family)
MSLARVLVVSVLLCALVACTSGPGAPDDGPYLTEIQQRRAELDAYFKSSDGPLLPEKRATFTGLPYFPIDPLYRVPARLEVNTVDRATILELPQSHTAEKRKVRRIGVLHFSLPTAGEGEMTLTAFVEMDSPDMNRLFVPFTDATSNKETYGGGRYLELSKTPTGLYDLDFNRAYHPYCLFNPSFECPVPPRENRLMAAIRAGEKMEQ